MRAVGAFAAIALALAAAAAAQPASGGAQRAAILDALRPAVERRLGPDVEFVVHSIRVDSGWAVVMADPQRRGGRAIDATRYFPADDLQFMDGITVTAVLRLRNARWRLVDHAIGATDVWYCDGVTMPPAVAARFGC